MATTADYARNPQLLRERAALAAQVAALEAAGEDSWDARDALRRARLRLDEVTGELVRANLGLAHSYAARFAGGGAAPEAVDDFYAAAVAGLVRAVMTCDPELGKFGPWAYRHMRKEVLAAVRQADHPNLNAGDFEARPGVLRAEAALSRDRPGARPSHEQVAAAAGVTVEQVRRIRDAPRVASLDAPLGDSADAGTLADLLDAPGADAAEQLVADLQVRVLLRDCLPCLEPREVFVLLRRFGLDGEPPMPLATIGEPLGLPRETVRQLQEKAYAKLNHPVLARRLARFSDR